MQYKWTVVTVTTVGVVMAGIDSRIVVVGLPTLAKALGADAEQAVWFTQAYVLATTVSLLLFGRVTDIFGRVRIYNMGFIIFTVGSALISISQDPLQVIVFRAVQGFGAAAIFANSIAMIVDATPRSQLGLFLGLNQISFRLGAMAGLTISGVILSFIDWRALFYINIPIGVFGTVWSRYRLKEIAVLEKGAPVDWVGFGTLTVSLTSLLLALTFGVYEITGLSITAVLLALSAAAFSTFILQERRSRFPLLDLGLFRDREFTGGIVALLLSSLSWGAVLFLLSLHLQLVLGYNSYEAGIRIIPFDIAFLLVGPVSGRLSDKYGSMPFTTGGILLSTLGLYLLSLVGAQTPYPVLAAYMVVLAAGTGAFVSPNTSSVMSSVPPHRRGVASGTRATVFNVGFAASLSIGILLMTTVAPYSLISSVIGTSATSLPTGSADLFAASLQRAYLWLAVINAAALVPSLLRGRRGAAARGSDLKAAPQADNSH